MKKKFMKAGRVFLSAAMIHGLYADLHLRYWG